MTKVKKSCLTEHEITAIIQRVNDKTEKVMEESRKKQLENIKNFRPMSDDWGN